MDLKLEELFWAMNSLLKILWKVQIMKRLLVLFIKKKKELETRIEELEDEVEMEREEAEKALDAAMRWRKHQMSETVLKHNAVISKLIDRIKWLKNSLLNKDQEISRRDYLAAKELPALPKKQKENRLHKLKN